MRSISMALVLLGLAVAFGRVTTAQSVAAIRSHPPTRVVFVCEHGSVKSLVAMQHFNRRSRERGLPYRAVARGIAPEATVPAVVREGLHADGFDVSGFVPGLLSASDVDDVTLVVSFDEDIAQTVGGRARYLKWDDLPGVLANYPRGRDAIVSQVDALIEALAPKGSP